MKIKNNGEPDDDNITDELLKHEGDAVETMMLEIISTIWKRKKPLEYWIADMSYPILKKGDNTPTTIEVSCC